MSGTPATPYTGIGIGDFTEVEIDGSGVFDVMMRSVAKHLEVEFKTGRIKGPEYAQVYLGSLQSTQQRALEFLLRRDELTYNINVLAAQECKLKAEFDAIMASIPKLEAETSLLNQKRVTETAQTNGTSVAPESVIGKQMTLYGRQADGFVRDAEQKAAKIMADTWNVRRTTDEGTIADATNKLDDATIGRTITQLLAGINA